MGKPIERNWSETQVIAHIAALPIWRGKVAIEPLPGGLQNSSYVVTDGGVKHVARLGFDLVHLGTIEANVRAAMKGAAELGVTPALRYAEPHLTISDFIEGRVLREEDIRNPAMLERVIRLLKRLHAGGAAVHEPLECFWPFYAIRNLAHHALKTESRHKAEVPPLLPVIDRLERAALPFLPCFTHNDAAYVNIMEDEAGRLWLIDWDYGAYGDPLWDLAEMLCYVCSEEALDRAALALYCGKMTEAERAMRLRQHRAFQLMSYLRQYFFCIIQVERGSREHEDAVQSMDHVFGEKKEEGGYAGFLKLARRRFDDLYARCGDDY
ncbi:MAG TPA: choline/ethanolamine kinase family protein [Alphaproteobacteria bacterium]|nr:choline/ethanolamine kinase family protein [Alphaproteobacteria bacterium]